MLNSQAETYGDFTGLSSLCIHRFRLIEKYMDMNVCLDTFADSARYLFCVSFW